MMINYLVGGWFFATPLKNDGVSEFVSWDDILFPTEWKKMFQTTSYDRLRWFIIPKSHGRELG